MAEKTITVADIVRIFGPCEIQDERGIFVPIASDYKNDLYDIKIQRKETAENFPKDEIYGKQGEEAIRSMIEDGDTIEVKTERGIWLTSDNVAIEWKKDDTGEYSGIAKTKADWWFCVLDNRKNGETLKDCAGFYYPVKKLKDKVRPSILSHSKNEKPQYKVVKGGDDNNSWLVLLPILELFTSKFVLFLASKVISPALAVKLIASALVPS